MKHTKSYHFEHSLHALDASKNGGVDLWIHQWVRQAPNVGQETTHCTCWCMVIPEDTSVASKI